MGAPKPDRIRTNAPLVEKAGDQLLHFPSAHVLELVPRKQENPLHFWHQSLLMAGLFELGDLRSSLFHSELLLH